MQQGPATLILSSYLLYLLHRKIRPKKGKLKSHSQELVINHSRIALNIGLFRESSITDIILTYLDGATVEQFFSAEEGALIKRPLVADSLLRLGTLNVWRQFTIFNICSWETHFSSSIKLKNIKRIPMNPSMKITTIERLRILSRSLEVEQDERFTLLFIPEGLSICELYLAFKKMQEKQSKDLNLDIQPKGAPYLCDVNGREYYKLGSGLFGTGRRTNLNKYVEYVSKSSYILTCSPKFSPK